MTNLPSTTNSGYTLSQIIQNNSKSGAFLRLIYAVIIPWGLISTITYLVVTHRFNWLLTIHTLYVVAAIVLVLAFLATFPWTIGTALYGHILLPYLTFILTGQFGTYTYGLHKPSRLIINHQIFLRQNHHWLPLDTYLLNQLATNNLKLKQN